MDRCPNCGSTVRQGAKFCTTCGFRLPVQAESTAPTAPAAPTRSPFDITSSASANATWGAAGAKSPTDSTQPAAGPNPQTADVEQRQPGDAPFSGWPAYGSGLGPRSSWPGAAESNADVPESVTDANAPAESESKIDVEATYEAPTDTTGDTSGSDVIDLNAMAEAEDTGFDAVASFFDRSTRDDAAGSQEVPPAASEPADDAVAEFAADPGAPANDVNASSDAGEAIYDPLATARTGESGTGESVTDYLTRVNRGADAESVSDYLDRIDEQNQPAADSAAPEPADSSAGAPTVDSGTAVDEGGSIVAEAPADDHEPSDFSWQSSAASADVAERWDDASEADGTPADAEPTPGTLDVAAETAASSEEAATDVAVGADTDSGEDAIEPSPPDTVPAAEAVGGDTETAVPAESDPSARAAALVAELQALLPKLSERTATSSVDAGAVADALAAQRALTVDDEALQSLRATIATAQARPRDVDVMLELVSKAATVADLLVAHDRFAKAIDDAVAALRGDAPAPPAPRW